jgi:RNA polymerase sigma-70 factor, ECF subfamily
MEAANILALPGAQWDRDDLGDAGHRGVVLEHYDREHLALRRYVLFLGIDADEAQDVVQESFLKLHEHLLAGGERTNLRAWLFRVVHNLARNRQTQALRIKTAAWDTLTGEAEPAANHATPEQTLLSQERDMRLQEAMNTLSRAQKECLALRAQGLKYREIADVLQLSISTVAENVQRALEQLRKVL